MISAARGIEQAFLRRRALLAIGERAPEFTLPDQDGRSVSLSTLLRDGPLILYFYPADFTRGCTREACAIRDLHTDIAQAGLSVAGVSPQSPETHRKFRDQYQLPYTLLSDADKFVIRIDQARYIRAAVLADFRISRHEDFIRKAVALSAVSGARKPATP
jgi:peroxiredoxin Q/BCP